MGIVMSQETKDKISAANRGRIPYNKNISMSSEQKKLLSEVNNKKRGKLIDVYTSNNIFIESLLGINNIARKYNTDKRTVQRVLTNRRKQSKGFIFKYHLCQN